MLFVDATHESGCRRQYLIDEDEDGFLGAELDALADHVDELAYGEICGDEVLLLVDGSNVGLFNLFTDNLRGDVLAIIQNAQDGRRQAYRDAVGVFLANAFGFSLPLLEGMLILEFGTHGE